MFDPLDWAVDSMVTITHKINKVNNYLQKIKARENNFKILAFYTAVGNRSINSKVRF